MFGAWCDRAYGFVYNGVRAHGGLAHFPLLTADGALEWTANLKYKTRELARRDARAYPELDIEAGVPIYKQYEREPGRFDWAPNPGLKASAWNKFEP